MKRLEKAALVLMILGLLAGASCASWLSNGDSTPLPPVTINHHSPSISAITATPSSIVPDGTINLVATASDADTGDTLTYAWTGTGTFGTANAASTTWTHGTVGEYSLTCTVTDSTGLTTAGVVSVIVAQPQPPGPVNDPPVPDPDGMSGDVAAPVAGQKVIFRIDFTDPNGDPLTVNWDDGSGSSNFSDMGYDASHGGFHATWTAPDAGNFTITATADDGKAASADKHVFVTASTSLGVTVGAFPASFDFVGYATCLGCHNTMGDEAAGTGWFSTNHSKAMQTNGTLDPANAHAYRNQACYNCHALGWAPTSGVGFVDFEMTPQFANIQCESCHGGGNPSGMGTGHKPQPWDPGLGYQHDATTGLYVLDADNVPVADDTYDGSGGYGCGQCHEGARHGAFEDWAKSDHAQQNLAPQIEGDAVGPPGEANCVKCHNGQYFVSIQIDGGAPPAADLTIADMKPYVMGINCATCHDPHVASNEFQLRVGPDDSVTIPWDDTVVDANAANICLKCHNGRRTRADYVTQTTMPGSTMRGAHGNAQGAFFYGLMGADLGSPAVTYSVDHPHRLWNQNGCVTCHMFRHDYVDAGNPTDWGHDFEPTFEACITCHTNYDITQEAEFWTWVEDFQTNEVQSRLDAFVAAWPAAWKDVSDPASPVLRFKNSAPGVDDGPFHDAAGDPNAPEQLKGNAYRECLWNYKLVNADASKGVHNPTFAEDLLDKTIARLNELNAAP